MLFPDPSAEFESLYLNISLDARMIPSTSGESIRVFYERFVLDNESYEKKGEFMKQSAWYSIIKLLDSIDPVWHARLYMAEKAAEMLTRTHGKTNGSYCRSGSFSPGVHEEPGPIGLRGFHRQWQRGVFGGNESFAQKGRQLFVDSPRIMHAQPPREANFLAQMRSLATAGYPLDPCSPLR